MIIVNTTFFCGLDQISLPMTMRSGERFANDYYLTRDKGKIVDIVNKFRDALGYVELGYLTNVANALIYRISYIESSSADQKNVSEALAKQLIDDMLAIKGLDLALWSIKDNACHFDRAWIAGTLNGRPIVNNNFWASRHSCADGSYRAVSFSSEELRVARGSRRPTGTHLNGVNSPTALGKGLLRFQRFEYFVGAARASIDVAVKIAQYCSGLEALVSTSQQELSHQVSERVAVVLAGPGAKRIAIFKLVKKAYGFRSKAVHGASFKPTEVDQLRACSLSIDQVCRDLQALYSDDGSAFRTAVEEENESSSDFFTEALMGAPTPQDLLGIEFDSSKNLAFL